MFDDSRIQEKQEHTRAFGPWFKASTRLLMPHSIAQSSQCGLPQSFFVKTLESYIAKGVSTEELVIFFNLPKAERNFKEFLKALQVE